MIFQEVDISRYITVVVIQSIVCGIFLLISFKILRRNRNRLAIFASCFYMSLTIGMLFNYSYLFLKKNPGAFILHFISVYFIFSALIFPVIFNISILKISFINSTKKILGIILFYEITLFIFLALPGGIILNETSEWRPQWSWDLFMVLLLFFTFSLIIPYFYLSIKIYNKFTDDNLKKRWKLYILGFCGFTFTLYGYLLYNTWNNEVYRIIWSFLTSLFIISGLLTYYGIGKHL